MAFSVPQSQLATALKELDDVPEAVKQMFLTSLPNAFGPDVHPYQKEVAAMMRNSLETARTSAVQKQDATGQQTTEAQAALDACQASVEVMQSNEEAARVVLNEKVLALDKAKAAVKVEETLSAKVEDRKGVVAEERQKLEAAKAEAESVQNGTFRMLLDGGWEDDEVRDACIEAVCSYLQENVGDAVLLAALPKALASAPAQRGAFDAITIDEASSVMSAKVAALVAELAEGEAKFEDAGAEALGAWAILDVARDHEQAASEVRDKADVDLHRATEEKKVAAAKVVEQDGVLAMVLSQSALLEATVQKLDLALAALGQLEKYEEVVDKENAMVVDKENVQAKENVMAVEFDGKTNAMEVDEPSVLSVAITA